MHYTSKKLGVPPQHDRGSPVPPFEVILSHRDQSHTQNPHQAPTGTTRLGFCKHTTLSTAPHNTRAARYSSFRNPSCHIQAGDSENHQFEVGALWQGE
jgi:hypothetical protein